MRRDDDDRIDDGRGSGFGAMRLAATRALLVSIMSVCISVNRSARQRCDLNIYVQSDGAMAWRHRRW